MGWIEWAKALFALIATLSLLGLTAYAARRYGLLTPGGGTGPLRRLKIAESLMLDPRRRLILIKLDNREHLLLLSPSGDRVITDVEARAEVDARAHIEAQLGATQ